MTAPAIAQLWPRIDPLLRMLSSPVDGEALAAARAIVRVLKANGSDLHDFVTEVAPKPEPPTPQDLARWILDIFHPKLNEWQRGFLSSVAEWQGRLTEKQQAKLKEIHQYATRGQRHAS